MNASAQPRPAQKSRRSRFFANAGRQILGVSPQGNAYRFVLVTVSRGKVSTLVDLGVFGEDRPDVEKALSRTGWVHGAGEALLVLPRHELIIKYLRLPTNDAGRIATMIDFELQAHSPWPLESTVASHEFLESQDDGHSLIALYMAKLETVQDHLNRLEALHVSPTRVEPTTRGLAVLLASVPNAELPALYVCDEGVSEYVRLSRGHHAYSRGTTGDTDPLAAFRESVESDERRHGNDASSYHFVVGGVDPALVAGMVADDRGDVLIDSVQDTSFAVMNGVTGLSADVLTGVAGTVGVIDPVESANLLPEADRRRLQIRQFVKQARIFAVLIAWLVAVVTGALYYEYRNLDGRIAKAQQRIEDLGPDIQALREKNHALTQFQRERAKVSLPLRIVLELYDRTPKTMAISSFRYEERGRLILGGEARGYPEVFDFVNALEESPILQNCQSKHTSDPAYSVGNWIEFRVECEVVD